MARARHCPLTQDMCLGLSPGPQQGGERSGLLCLQPLMGWSSLPPGLGTRDSPHQTWGGVGGGREEELGQAFKYFPSPAF